MKFLKFCILLATLLTNQLVLANCNPKDIKFDKKTGYYLYPKECHIYFGNIKKEVKLREQQKKHDDKTIELQDLALSKANGRINNWQQATYKLEDRVLKMDKNNERLRWIYFGLGIFVTGAAVWGAGQLR